MTDLAGKTAVSTGSTSGIGLGLARGFAQAGAKVVLNGSGDAAEIEKTRAERKQGEFRQQQNAEPPRVMRLVHRESVCTGRYKVCRS